MSGGNSPSLIDTNQQQPSQHGQQPGPGQFPEQPQMRRLTAEEMRAFRECNRESFYYRSVPFSILGMVGVRYLGSTGYLKPSPVYGMYMKYATAVVLGYFIGKFSYLNKCRQKLMSLPNSALAEELKKSYGGGKRQLEVFQEMVTLPEMKTGSGGQGDQGYAPIREGSDMYNNPDFSVSGGPNAQAGDHAPPKQATSYDELRRRNREDYLRQQFGVGPAAGAQHGQGPIQHHHQQQQQPPPPAPQEHPQPPKPRFSYGTPPQASTASKYGDTDFK